MTLHEVLERAAESGCRRAPEAGRDVRRARHGGAPEDDDGRQPRAAALLPDLLHGVQSLELPSGESHSVGAERVAEGAGDDGKTLATAYADAARRLLIEQEGWSEPA